MEEGWRFGVSALPPTTHNVYKPPADRQWAAMCHSWPHFQWLCGCLFPKVVEPHCKRQNVSSQHLAWCLFLKVNLLRFITFYRLQYVSGWIDLRPLASNSCTLTGLTDHMLLTHWLTAHTLSLTLGFTSCSSELTLARELVKNRRG